MTCPKLYSSKWLSPPILPALCSVLVVCLTGLDCLPAQFPFLSLRHSAYLSSTLLGHILCGLKQNKQKPMLHLSPCPLPCGEKKKRIQTLGLVFLWFLWRNCQLAPGLRGLVNLGPGSLFCYCCCACFHTVFWYHN